MTFKNKIFRIIEKGSHGNRINLIFDYAIISLIILSLVSIILESIKEVSSEIKIFLEWFDLFSVSVFTVEYMMRLYVSDFTHPSKNKITSIFKFVFSLGGLIDLLAITPFYLPFLITVDLRFLRTLRLLRILRVLKINRYTKSLHIIWSVLKEKKSELGVTGFITILILVFASFLMYTLEGDKQPDKFPNILATFWWAIATLTTVGYGDVYPITIWGKFISSLIALLGIGIVALPTGIIGAGFIEKINTDKKRENTSDKTN